MKARVPRWQSLLQHSVGVVPGTACPGLPAAGVTKMKVAERRGCATTTWGLEQDWEQWDTLMFTGWAP